jgi:hypothetical protein
MARPVTYTPKVVAEALDYVENYALRGDAVPSVVGLCRAIDRARSTVYDWASQEGNEFGDILQMINENQEHVCINKSITGEYNAAIAKLLLGKHGYSDNQKVESNITIRDVTEMTDEELARIASTGS